MSRKKAMTSAIKKNIAEPITKGERYEKLKLKNDALELLKYTFDLEII